MKSVDRVLSCLGTRPREFLLKHGDSDIVPSSFKHRFTTSADMNNFLRNIREVLMKYETVEELAKESKKRTGSDRFTWLEIFTSALTKNQVPHSFPILSSPSSGSAAKRLCLFLRWLIRSDCVDPGGWHSFSPSCLLIPCDTHMHRISTILHLTSQPSPNFKAVQQITSAFRSLSPSDPAKYDFPLTRFGIRSGLSFYCS